MKFSAIFLCLLFVSLIVNPCSDGNNLEDALVSEENSNHDHSEDSDDSCAILCFCNCCGATVTYQPISVFEPLVCSIISNLPQSKYSSIYKFAFSSQPWEPPRCIS